MQTTVKHTNQWGRVLWVTTDTAEVGIALDFGIRLVHLSCPGMENLYYVQNNDLSDGFAKDNGWRLYGGHRLWLAPESALSYTPENAPISYTINGNTLQITQATDEALKIVKSMTLEFCADGEISVTHEIRNISTDSITGASWGINTLDAGGTAFISFDCGTKGGYNPKRTVSLWSDTNLHDSRLRFDRNSLTATHLPLPEYLKLGLYTAAGRAEFRNKGQCFVITFKAAPMASCPDGGCNLELYMNIRFTELETLGTVTDIPPGCCASHQELWRLGKL
jgi:hypothetical protein